MQAGFVVDKWQWESILSKQLYFLRYSILIAHTVLTLYNLLRLQYQRTQLCPSPIVQKQKLYGTETI